MTFSCQVTHRFFFDLVTFFVFLSEVTHVKQTTCDLFLCMCVFFFSTPWPWISESFCGIVTQPTCPTLPPLAAEALLLLPRNRPGWSFSTRKFTSPCTYLHYSNFFSYLTACRVDIRCSRVFEENLPPSYSSAHARSGSLSKQERRKRLPREILRAPVAQSTSGTSQRTWTSEPVFSLIINLPLSSFTPIKQRISFFRSRF